jgi:hypothetical protein
MKLFFSRASVLFLFLTTSVVTSLFSGSLLDTIFPLENYSQDIAEWMHPTNLDFLCDQPLLENKVQQKRQAEFYKHYFGISSPWNEAYVQNVLSASDPNSIAEQEEQSFTQFNVASTYYGNNSPNNPIPYSQGWLDSIKANSNLVQLDSLSYAAGHRGITTANLAGRILPTEQHAYLNPTLPGEGDTFDYLQMSAVWIGTPVYVIATTKDGAWDLVLTPDFIAWVESRGVGMADATFIQNWSAAAQENLVAIIKTETPLRDPTGNLLSLTYVGTVFPKGESDSTLMVPMMDAHQHAVSQEISVSPDAMAQMPLSLTPHSIATIMSTLIGRSYGWGGMNFGNDCSAETKSLFTPFGIYLPRHSSDQVSVGAMVDEGAAAPADRLSYLMENGKPFLSLIYIGGHIVLYTGNNPNPNDPGQQPMAMTYQNLWGLGPIPPITISNPARRAVIGKAVLFPMLLQYPEDTGLNSLAAHAAFQICDLSTFAEVSSDELVQVMAVGSDSKEHAKKPVLPRVDIHSMMTPEAREDF